jgi:hypothetical protein
MNAFTFRHGTDFDPCTLSLSGEWRATSFKWLAMAAGSRRIVRLAGRSPDLQAIRRSHIEEVRHCLANARRRAGWARECGHRLP